MKSKRTAVLLAVAVLGTAGQQATNRLETRPECVGVDVLPGDTLTRIAAGMDVALSDLLAANRQVVNPNLIWPGQRVCYPTVQIGEPLVVEAPPVTPVVDWPGHNKFITGETVVDGVASQALILRALHNAGARGDQLISLAAVTECESNRRLNAVGDLELVNHAWGGSVTPWQIRTAHNQRSRGTARDIEALTSDPLGHGARAAIEIYDASAARGHDPMRPWTCHLNGHDRNFVQPYTVLASKMGMLS